jgi:hypothetical protein
LTVSPESKPDDSRPVHKRGEVLVVALILAVGAALRFYGLNWDGGHWLHPDERQIYFVVLKLGWPDSLAEALSPASPLNPGFFAYGSLPVYLLKLLAAVVHALWPAFVPEVDLHLVARPLAVLADLGTIYLTYRLARVLWGTHRRRGMVAVVAAAFTSLAVLHVQLAHFYTVDPLLTFFTMLTLNLAADVAQVGGRGRRIALGTAFGLALATKVTAAPLFFVVLVACLPRSPSAKLESPIRQTVRRLVLPLAVAGAVFFIAQPYALIDWPTFVEQTIRESQIARGQIDVPYTLQYAGTLPFVYSVWQTALWGLGLPVGLVAWLSLAAALVRWLRRGLWAETLLLSWVGPYLVITGLLYTKYLRYMLPVVPVLCLLAAGTLAGVEWRPRNPVDGQQGLKPRTRGLGSRLASGATVLLILTSLAYALAFARLYAAPHSWVSASEWIYRNVPAGSTLAVEHWDTALPLTVEVDGIFHGPRDYAYQTLTLYDEPDGATKWAALAGDLSSSDYLVIASRRLYGSIPRSPDRYPVATHYYELLFAGELGFEPVAEFSRHPAWLNPRLPPLPDAAPAMVRPDESFVVYDHPRALLFRNAKRLPAEELLRRLGL